MSGEIFQVAKGTFSGNVLGVLRNITGYTVVSNALLETINKAQFETYKEFGIEELEIVLLGGDTGWPVVRPLEGSEDGS